MEKWQTGDMEAFQALFRQYEKLVFRTAYLMLTVATAVILAVVISSCIAPAPAPTPEPTLTSTPVPDINEPSLEVSVSRLSIHCPVGMPEQLAYKYARMVFEFKIHNPNDEAVILEKFGYAVYGDGHAVGGAERPVRGEFPDRAIAPYGTNNVDFHLPYISKDEDHALWSEMAEGNVIWTIKGVAHIRYSGDEFDVPFECTVKDYSLQIDERCN